MLDLSALRQALSASAELLEKVSNPALMASLGPVIQQGLRSGVIQHFEFSYELCWKMLKRQIEEDAASPSDIDALSYKDLIREGAERGYIDNPEAWFEYRLKRNLTSHTYNQKRADEVFAAASRFFSDAQKRLTQLEARGAR